MTCEECEERVFELIEREVDDPEGVQRILSRCPECQTLFNRMKAALAEAERLPREEPSPGIDAAILQAAAERAAETGPRRRSFPGAPWAVAAAALLAVSVGVWSIPQAPKPSTSPPNELPREAAARGAAEPARADRDPATTARPALLDETEIAAVQPRRARTASNATADREQAAVRAGAPPDATGAMAEAAFQEPDDVSERKKRGAKLSPACQTLRQRLEQGVGEADASTESVNPEDALSLGRCYRDVGELSEARRWFRVAASHPETRRRARKELQALGRR